MDAISTVRAIDPWIPVNVKCGAMELSNCNTYIQESSMGSHQKDATSVQQRISDSIFQFIESNEMKLDFEINRMEEKIAVKVIRKATGEIIRQITLTPEVIKDIFKGVIYKTLA